MRCEKGKVYLVGAGPGDPQLLTVKALRLMETADVVVYDRLVSAEVLQLVATSVARIYVGKACGDHTLNQREIDRVLIDQARSGRGVVRLKGGDPFIFGRGGEEALALAAAGIDFEVVPGITAAQACAAYAGIPLTHRGLAHGIQFVSGHRKNNDRLRIDPATLSDVGQTLVIYMGLETLPQVVAQVLAAGREAQTPAAIIEHGTLARQRMFVTTLGRLSAEAKLRAVEAPALIVIGKVVSLADSLDWFLPTIEQGRQCYG